MEGIKITCEGNKMVIEGEIDTNVELNNIYIGHHKDLESTKFAAATFTADCNVHLSDLEEMFRWINQNSGKVDVNEDSKWRITFERLS